MGPRLPRDRGAAVVPPVPDGAHEPVVPRGREVEQRRRRGAVARRAHRAVPGPPARHARLGAADARAQRFAGRHAAEPAVAAALGAAVRGAARGGADQPFRQRPRRDDSDGTLRAALPKPVQGREGVRWGWSHLRAVPRQRRLRPLRRIGGQPAEVGHRPHLVHQEDACRGPDRTGAEIVLRGPRDREREGCVRGRRRRIDHRRFHQFRQHALRRGESLAEDGQGRRGSPRDHLRVPFGGGLRHEGRGWHPHQAPRIGPEDEVRHDEHDPDDHGPLAGHAPGGDRGRRGVHLRPRQCMTPGLL
mmetsp:Transcript_100654/g.307596  ORF Transcript_100654/g.307596 Transcript_100654/m.307596 type:complete len:303 (+) Transcript_100654:609-1517(+)